MVWLARIWNSHTTLLLTMGFETDEPVVIFMPVVDMSSKPDNFSTMSFYIVLFVIVNTRSKFQKKLFTPVYFHFVMRKIANEM